MLLRYKNMFIVMLHGRVTKEPEIKELNNQTVCNFTLCVKGVNSDVSFIRCSCWNKQAENFVKYVEKGQLLTITGHGTLKSESKSNEFPSILNVNCMTIEYGAKSKSTEQKETVNEVETNEVIDLNDYIQPI